MTNHVFRSAASDGTVLGYSLPGIIATQLLEPDRARFDGRELEWIGSAIKYTGIISVASSAPATTIDQARTTELFIGTTGRGSPAHQFPAMAQALLGLQFNIVTGYESSSDVVLAMERGEVDGQSSSLQYWAITRPDWLTDGRIVPLLYAGPPSPLTAPGVPFLRDLVSTARDTALVEFIEIGANMGWPLFAPPRVPNERVAILRDAFASMVSDPEFERAMQTRVRAQLSPSIGNELAEYVEIALNTSESTLSEARAILDLNR